MALETSSAVDVPQEALKLDQVPQNILSVILNIHPGLYMQIMGEEKAVQQGSLIPCYTGDKNLIGGSHWNAGGIPDLKKLLQGKLTQYLRRKVEGFPAESEVSIRQFSHGQSNPTYLIEVSSCTPF